MTDFFKSPEELNLAWATAQIATRKDRRMEREHYDLTAWDRINCSDEEFARLMGHGAKTAVNGAEVVVQLVDD